MDDIPKPERSLHGPGRKALFRAFKNFVSDRRCASQVADHDVQVKDSPLQTGPSGGCVAIRLQEPSADPGSMTPFAPTQQKRSQTIRRAEVARAPSGSGAFEHESSFNGCTVSVVLTGGELDLVRTDGLEYN